MSKVKKADAGKVVFEMFAFQYKPLEKQLFKWCKKDHPEIIEKYKKADYTLKIQMLDRVAEELGY
jgi:hypothetical protein